MNPKIIFFTPITLALLWLGTIHSAQAETTVRCESKHFQYNECYAKSFSKPQLIHQISQSSCILNRSWGFNPNSGYLWVSQGCAGVFADQNGYHHGKSGTYDQGARTYGSDGKDTGAAVAGAILGAVILGALDSSDHHKNHSSQKSNYDGCHGVGCDATPPPKKQKNIDTRPQFDKDGNPNFDTHGNWIGCHGMGCDVDNPDY